MYQKFLNDAQLYSSAAWILSKKINGQSFDQRERLLPSHLLKAFSLELYFKVLLNLTGGGQADTAKEPSNNLVEMYRTLDKNLRNQMETSFSRVLIGKQLPDAWPLDEETRNQIPRDLEGNLLLWSKLLERFRLPNGLESEEEMPQVWFSREIEEVVRTTLSSLKTTGTIEKVAS